MTKGLTIPGWPEELAKMAYTIKTIRSPIEDIVTFEAEEYDFFVHCVKFMSDNCGASQNFQDAWVTYKTNGKRNGYFVEFGAFDGTYGSNSLVVQKKYDWKGILCEPNPNWTERIQKFRAGPGIHIDTTHCVTGRTGDQVTFVITEDSSFSTIQEFADSDYNSEFRKNNTQSITCPTISLNDLLLKYSAPTVIDLLSIDTEGSELEILSAFDFDRWDVRHICVEHNYLPAREDIHNLLSKHGYIREFVAFSRWDDLYTREG